MLQDNLEQSDENWNDGSHINENDNVLASNVDIDIDDHFIPYLYIYDPRNWGIFYAKIILDKFNWKR